MASTSTPNPATPNIESHIDTGTVNANPTWREAAIIAAARLARQRDNFTSFDVLQELEKSDLKTHDLRAIGGVMKEVCELGLISSCGLVRRNDKYSRGATTLWQSNVRGRRTQTKPDSTPEFQ